MQADIERVLIDRDAIARRIDAVADRIASDLAAQPGATTAPGLSAQYDGLEITIVPILTGSIIFLADLIRRLPMRMQIHLLSISSYPGRTTSSRGATVREDLTSLPDSLAGAHVLIVDDILDSGNTLRLVTDMVKKRRPATLRTCVLLRKDRPQARRFDIDYVCFDIPDEFVVGFGLDYNDYYRNLPDIVTLRPAVLSQSE